MEVTTFDTHRAVKALRDAGADEAMAEAIVNTASAAAGHGRDALAMKADLAGLRADLYRALWMQGSALVAAVLAAKLVRRDRTAPERTPVGVIRRRAAPARVRVR